jgi:hypothetical protein
MAGMTGGCMCGAVRYELTGEPFDCGWCHCRTCQLASGAPAMTFASVATGQFIWRKGEDLVRTIPSSSFSRRTFCGGCGSPFMMEVDHQPETVDFTIATLDSPDAVVPEFHIFWASKIGWFAPGDTLPRHERFRRGTRGLDGTEPPGS